MVCTSISSVSPVFERLTVIGARPIVSIFKDHDFKVPKSVGLSSVISSVQTPDGFSPFKFSSVPSGRNLPVNGELPVRIPVGAALSKDVEIMSGSFETRSLTSSIRVPRGLTR